jgi:flagellar basal-body rod modification protein FlgD
VLDSAGRVVRQQVASLGATPSGWTWDGRDAAGRSLPDGAYRVQVTGRGANGEAAALPFSVAGTVTGAERQGDALLLSLGALGVGFDRLRRLLPET